MMLRRLTMLPRFCFSEAAQTIEGNHRNTQDISLQHSLIPPQGDTQDPFSLQLPKAKLCRQSLKIWLTSEAYLENQLLSDKFSKTQQYAATNRKNFSIPSHPPPTARSPSTSSTPSSSQAGSRFTSQTFRTIKNHWHLSQLLQNPQQVRRHQSYLCCRSQPSRKGQSFGLTEEEQTRSPIQSHLRSRPCHSGWSADLCWFIVFGLLPTLQNWKTKSRTQ